MESLLFFIFWAALIFLMMRFGCGAHVTGHGGSSSKSDGPAASSESEKLRWVPPETDVDPVCGKTVKTERAKPSVHDGAVYYFCSRECREAFEAAPELYIDDGKPDQRALEHSHV